MNKICRRFEKDSEEYKTLEYRIMSGQLFQQNAIDKAKGIIAKPMPRYWHDRHSVNLIEDPEEKRFQLSIVADKKPYFMRVIYPTLSRQYNTYVTAANKNAIREFGKSIDELLAIPAEELLPRQRDFIRYYHSRMPVGTGDCVMNKICRRFEQEFDGYLRRHTPNTPFDLSTLKGPIEYSKTEYKNISKLYDSYSSRVRAYMSYTCYERVDEADLTSTLLELQNEFRRACDVACPDTKSLCNIILDICYKKRSTKKFAWDMCGEEIIKNMLEKHDRTLEFPTVDPDGDVYFCGKRFSVKKVRMEEDYGDCAE